MTRRRERENIDDVRRRAIATALAATGMAAQAHAAQAQPTGSAARAASAPRHRGGYYIPAPRQVRFVRGLPPGASAANEGLGYAAGTDPANGVIYFQGNLSRSARAHEVGHLLDAQALTDGDRHFFTRIMGLSGAWDQGTGLSGTKSPKEVFADWYGNAANGRDGVQSWDSAYASPPDPKAYKQFRQALQRLARRQQLARYQR